MRARLFSWAFIALLMATGVASAQQGTSELRGRVEDAQGGVLPGVSVIVTNQATGMFRETISGEDGSFIASGLVPGTYQVTAELQGFKKFERKELRLEVGKTTSVDVAMQVGGLEETVNVTAESPIVDLTSKEIGGNITSDTLVKLPSVNGNFIGFVGLLPGIVPSVSTESFGSDSIAVNGQDPRNNNYMLDGGNNNDDVIGQRAGTQARTPIEAIQEFQVITGQYDAQYGRTSGAVVNAVTKSGTNNFKGVAFGFLQNAEPDREPLLREAAEPAEARHAVPALGRHARRPDRPEQDALLRQPRALLDRSSELDQHPVAARVQRHRADPRPRVEHDHPRRSPGQQHHHLQRALAARGVAAGEPDHRRPARRRRRRRRRARNRTSTRRCRSTSITCCPATRSAPSA